MILKNVKLVILKGLTVRSLFYRKLFFLNMELKELSPEYRAKVFLIAFDSFHLGSKGCRGRFPQVLFV